MKFHSENSFLGRLEACRFKKCSIFTSLCVNTAWVEFTKSRSLRSLNKHLYKLIGFISVNQGQSFKSLAGYWEHVWLIYRASVWILNHLNLWKAFNIEKERLRPKGIHRNINIAISPVVSLKNKQTYVNSSYLIHKTFRNSQFLWNHYVW